MQQPQIPKTIWIVFALLTILTILSILIAIRNPSGRSYPKQGQVNQTVVQPQIDYSKISRIVKQQIALLPAPQNGVDGKDGKSITGPKGDKGDSIVGPQGPAGQSIIGPQGEPGTPARQIEIRYNTAKNQIEYRYQGDFSWNLLVQACTLTNTCASP